MNITAPCENKEASSYKSFSYAEKSQKTIWYYSYDASGWRPEAARFAYGFLLWVTKAKGMITYAYQRPYSGHAKNFYSQDVYSVHGVPNYVHAYPPWQNEPGGPTTGWEGIREGIDDYKYIYTFFQHLAKAKTSGVRGLAEKAIELESQMDQELSKLNK